MLIVKWPMLIIGKLADNRCTSKNTALYNYISRLQMILLPRMPFFVCKKVQILLKKICHKFQILHVFCHPKMRPF